MRIRHVWWLTGGVISVVALLGAILAGPIMSNVEQPKYKLVEADKNIEIRDYGPTIVAEVEASGERAKAISEGFRLIADFIFGNNSSKQSGGKIAMTAPVTQQGSGNTWTVRFIMPAKYTLATLPKPNNLAVKLREIPGKRFAVIRFSGMAGEESLKRHTEELQAFISAKKLQALSGPTYAFYNPPWTLPFFRRNEVMIEVAT